MVLVGFVVGHWAVAEPVPAAAESAPHAAARALLLDRCVVSSAERHALEGVGASDLWAVASLIRARGAPFLRFERGVLEGVVLDDGVEDPLAGATGVSACVEHLRPGPGSGPGDPGRWTTRCALER